MEMVNYVTDPWNALAGLLARASLFVGMLAHQESFFKGLRSFQPAGRQAYEHCAAIGQSSCGEEQPGKESGRYKSEAQGSAAERASALTGACWSSER